MITSSRLSVDMFPLFDKVDPAPRSPGIKCDVLGSYYRMRTWFSIHSGRDVDWCKGLMLASIEEFG